MQDQEPGTSTPNPGGLRLDRECYTDGYDLEGEQLELFPDSSDKWEILANVLDRLGYNVT